MPTPRQTDRIRRKQPTGAARRDAKARRRRVRKYAAAWTGTAAGAIAARTLPYTKLSEAPADRVERASREKYPWIRRFVEEKCPRGMLLEYANLYASAAGLPSAQVPPYTTLVTWVKLYRRDGILGLVDKPRPEAGQSRTIVGEVEQLFNLYATLGYGATKILNKLAEMLVGRRRRPPKRAAIYRALARFEAANPHVVAVARMGPIWFRHVCEVALRHPVLPGGVRLALDSTVADIYVRVPAPGSPDQWTITRVVLTIVEDIGSRLLVTFNVALTAIDSGICVAVLGRAVDQSRNYPGLPSLGVPHEIALDRGAEHRDKLEAALKALTVKVVPREPDAPRGGAHVERLINTLQTEVFRNLPGYSKTEKVFDPYAPDERDSKRNLTQLSYEPSRHEVPATQLLTVAQLEARILAWATVYNERPHPALLVASPEIQGMLRASAEVQHASEQVQAKSDAQAA